MNSFLVSYPLQPLDCHEYRTFGFKLVFPQPSCIATRWHILHQSPKLQRVSIISRDFFTPHSSRAFFWFSDLCFACLIVTVKNDTWAACVVILDQVIKVTVGLIAEPK